MVALIYFNVCGGPYGAEYAVEAAGVWRVLILFLVLPLVWSVPEAFVMAEMATLFPENSGFVTWVGAAFGPYAGFMEGWLSWVSGVIDNAVYPQLLAIHVGKLDPSLSDYQIPITLS